MDALATDLQDVLDDPKASDEAKAHAKAMLERWNQGIIPSGGDLKTLAKLTEKDPDCVRMEHDGACGWLRKYGKSYDLSVPPVGQKAMCLFRGCFSQCPGYKKPRDGQ